MARDNRRPSHRPGKSASSGGAPAAASPCEAPYHFVPVRPDLAVTDTPVFHDVQQTGADSWSGELHCTLEALTPLLVGNYQYEYQFLAPDLQRKYQQILQERGVRGRPEDDKKLVEPLCLGRAGAELPGPVLLAGEALKGMVRQALQALLSAPMERVQERTFSFRPNLMDAENMVPAIVHRRVINKGRLVAMEVELAGRCNQILYVHEDAHPALQSWFEQAGFPQARAGLAAIPPQARRATINGTVPGVRIDSSKHYALKLRGAAPGSSAALKNHVLVRYRGGLDGRSTFATAFNGRPTTGYQWALVPVTGTNPTLLPIPPAVLANYSDTIHHLGDDEAGHLLSHPLKKDLASVRNETIPAFQKECPEVGDLILIERVNGAIVGMGHHFRHRRRYRDTVHLSHDPARRDSTQSSNLRDVLCPPALETTPQAGGPHAGAPQQLTGARCLFGYVGPDRAHYDPARPNEPLTFGIGVGDFKQLAGRVSINWAVEQGDPNRAPRFLNQFDKWGCLVPLRPLGAPKPSAVETYLTQDRLGQRPDQGTLCTYGDTVDDPAAGNLRGRKFYLHQPEAAKSRRGYELLDAKQPDWASGRPPRVTYHLLGNQAMIARFVSVPGTTFRFTLRFRDLRSWELGSLLFVLTADQPAVEQLAGRLEGDGAAALRRWLQRVPGWGVDETHPLLAHKLGHGRPLGLGSVRVRVEGAARLHFGPDGMPSLQAVDPAELRRRMVDALAGKLRQGRTPGQVSRWVEEVLLPWLQVHRYAGRKSFDYPRKDGLIYSYHTEERRKHSKGRKQLKPPGGAASPRPGGLRPLDDLDAGR